MTTLATPADLSLLLGVTVDTNRANLVLGMVEDLMSAVVSPLPAAAKTVELTAAARAFPNPSQLASQSEAGMSASWSPGGVYLTRNERQSLLRMAGNGRHAFSIRTSGKPDHRDPLRPLTAGELERFVLDEDVL